MAYKTLGGVYYPVDMVYLWVGGDDEAWREKFSRFNPDRESDNATQCKGRFSDNDELRHSLRSLEKYAPWIRKIFIVTDNQVPEWLNTENEKIRIVDHSEILAPEVLPTFNSCVIEHSLHKIEDLSEHFIYANDDMFLNKPVLPADFFGKDGNPIVRFNRRPFRKLWLWWWQTVLKKPLNNYKRTIHNTSLLVEKKCGKYIGHKTHHNIDAYRKSQYAHVYDIFRKEIEQTLTNHIRQDNDIQRNIYSYVPVIEKKAHARFVTKKTSFHCHIDLPRHFIKLERLNPTFFCLNDSEFSNDSARKMAKDFMEKKFPEKSKFEK